MAVIDHLLRGAVEQYNVEIARALAVGLCASNIPSVGGPRPTKLRDIARERGTAKAITGPQSAQCGAASPELPQAQSEMNLECAIIFAPASEALLNRLEPLAQGVHVDAELRCGAARVVAVVEVAEDRLRQGAVALAVVVEQLANGRLQKDLDVLAPLLLEQQRVRRQL